MSHTTTSKIPAHYQHKAHESYLELNFNFHVYQFSTQYMYHTNAIFRNIPPHYSHENRHWYHVSAPWMDEIAPERKYGNDNRGHAGAREDTASTTTTTSTTAAPTTTTPRKSLPEFLTMSTILNYQYRTIPSFHSNIRKDATQFLTTAQPATVTEEQLEDFERKTLLIDGLELSMEVPVSSNYTLPNDHRRDLIRTFAHSYFASLAHPLYPYAEQEFTQIPIYPNLPLYQRPLATPRRTNNSTIITQSKRSRTGTSDTRQQQR